MQKTTRGNWKPGVAKQPTVSAGFQGRGAEGYKDRGDRLGTISQTDTEWAHFS